MNLNLWTIKWGIPPAAIEDLRREFNVVNTEPNPKSGSSEAANQNLLRLEASRKGGRIWRNNNGACKDENGNFIRYGVANDSKRMNDRIKSSDLLGLRPVVIQPHHVGHILGQFIAREVKPGGWYYTGTPREKAQLKFLELVVSLGGDAAFATGEGTL